MILNDITESCQFDKIKMAQKAESSQDRKTTNTTSQTVVQILWWDPCAPTVPSIWEDMHWMWDDGPLQEGVQEQEGL